VRYLDSADAGPPLEIGEPLPDGDATFELRGRSVVLLGLPAGPGG
jgi:hypothetical protein